MTPRGTGRTQAVAVLRDESCAVIGLARDQQSATRTRWTTGFGAPDSQFMMLPRALVYARLSRLHGEEETSTGRQIKSCSQYAAAREWKIVASLRDVDLSGWRDGVVRPSYERLVQLVEDEAVDVILVWKLDRLMRRPSEFERLWAICERHGVSIASVTEPVDTTTPVGVAIVRMLITFASLESTVKGERIRSRFSAQALAGEPANFGRRVFGYADLRGQVLDASEAELIREAARRVVAGESCTAIANDFERRGITGSRRKPITHSGIRSILTNPRLVGDRAYRGSVVAENVYPAILPREVAAEVVRILETQPKGRRTTSLLCGLLQCALCGLTLHHATSRPLRDRLYRCGGANGCNRIGINAQATEDWIGRWVCQRIEARWVNDCVGTDLLNADEELRLQRTHANQFRRLHASYFGRGDISRKEFLAARRQLLDGQARAQRRTAPTRRPMQVPPSVDLTRASIYWPTLSRPARRSLIDLEISQVIVHPSPTRGGCRFNPDRLDVRWVRVGAYLDPGT